MFHLLVMGLFNDNIPAIMPAGAIDQINKGILPKITTDNIILTDGEECHFAERAILVTEKIEKHYEGTSNGISVRIIKNVTYRTGKRKGKPVEQVVQEKTKGLVYITNKRIIFLAGKNAFEKKYSTLTAYAPYSNAINLQFGTKTFNLMVPNGAAISRVISMIGKQNNNSRV